MRCGLVRQEGCFLLARRAELAVTRPEFCEAMTRQGTPCRRRPLKDKRRCRLHGGLSTGPRTAEGRARIAEALRARWSRQRPREVVPQTSSVATQKDNDGRLRPGAGDFDKPIKYRNDWMMA